MRQLLTDKPVNLIAQIPFEDHRQFQIKLLIENRTMQDWISEQVEALVSQPLDGVQPVPYARVTRKNIRMHTIIVRVKGSTKWALKLRLSLMGIPYSAWIHQKIQEYIRDVDLSRLRETLEKAGS